MSMSNWTPKTAPPPEPNSPEPSTPSTPSNTSIPATKPIPPTQPITLITGANTGIGYHLARVLSSPPHNHHILLCSRNASSGASAASSLKSTSPDLDLSIDPITLDITHDASITAAVDYVTHTYGRLDILINNAGISEYVEDGPLSEIRERWIRTLNTNVVGSYLVTRSMIPLLKRGVMLHPRIVFVSSTLGSLSDRVGKGSEWGHVSLESYRASKAGVNMVALGFAKEVEGERDRGKEIWVNAVCPGSVKTKINGFVAGRDVEDAIGGVVELVLRGDIGSGGFWDEGGRVGW